MANEQSRLSTFPPALGPGAQSMQPRESPQAMVRNIQEMRSHYTVKVDNTFLKIGYRINGAKREYEIPFDTAPITGFRRWLCYGGRGRALVSGTFLLDMVRGAENMTGQPLSQREAEAFAFHSAKRMQYGFGGMAFALAAGYGMAARGSKEMKFPFRKPQPMEKYEVFPFRRMPLLSGNYAKIAWQTTRANIYAALAIIFLSPVFRSMGESVMAVGLYRDERTREKVKAIKGGFDRIRMNRGLPGASQPAAQRNQPSSDDGTSDDFGSHDANSSSSYGDSNDYASDRSFSSINADNKTRSDVEARQYESRQAVYDSRKAQDNRQPQAQPQSSPSSSSSSSDFFFDDASPTARNDSNMTSQQYQRNTAGSGGMSTWDRIRKGGQSTSQSQTPQQSNQGRWRRSTPDADAPNPDSQADSFSFSSSESSRGLAKEQAQREFDNMLERERKESGSGEYSRSSLATENNNETPPQSTSGSAWSRRR